MAALRCKQASQFEDAGSAAGVIIGARMDLADLRWGKRIEVAAAEVIVVCADDDVFVGLSRQPRENVVDGGASGLDVDVKREMKSGGE